MDETNSLKTEERNSYLSDNLYRFRRTEAAEAFAKLIAEDVGKRPQVYFQKHIILEGQLSPLDCCMGSLRSQFQRMSIRPEIQRGSEATNGGIRFNLDDFVAGYVEAVVSESRDINSYMAGYSRANFPSSEGAA